MQKKIKQKLAKIYIALLKIYGGQGWWPTTSPGSFIPHYSGSTRHLTEKQILEICIGAILAQNTAWKNAEKAIIQLNKHRVINATKLATLDMHALAGYIRSSGYYNQKAKIIKNFLHVFGKKNFTQHFKKETGELKKELLNIKGIGKETADSILLYAAKKPVFVVDMYTQRVFSRLGFKERGYDELQNLFHKNLPQDFRMYNEYHALLVEFSKQICRKNPLCKNCFFQKECLYAKDNPPLP